VEPLDHPDQIGSLSVTAAPPRGASPPVTGTSWRGRVVRQHDRPVCQGVEDLPGGSDLKSVMDRMGHAQISTTQKYRHALPDADPDAKNLTALGRIRSPHPPRDPTRRAKRRRSSIRTRGQRLLDQCRTKREWTVLDVTACCRQGTMPF